MVPSGSRFFDPTILFELTKIILADSARIIARCLAVDRLFKFHQHGGEEMPTTCIWKAARCSIFPYFPLKSIIAAQGVCTLWRHLLPLSDIDKTRRGLLNLYFEIIESPVFVRTRPWVLENLQDFDRQAYIDALLDQHDYLPDDFRVWILEWPSKAVIACCWPGLPYRYWGYNETDDIERIPGCNFLGRIPPVLHTVQINRIGQMEAWVKVDVPALLIWEDISMYSKTWLVLGQKPVCSHAVYTLINANYDGEGEYGDLDRDEESESEDDNTEGEYAYHGVYSSWTYWLRCRFEETEAAAGAAQEAEESGTASLTGECGSGPHLDGVPVTKDEWFRARSKFDRVWAESHDTGRRHRASLD
ncbi:hypothetical protein B0H19DRAFT_1238816 [Mycena capillaripes]|nr:hypothetical protein B0H19DRAFT_1238816 [Mycena capillaripes]